MVESASQSLEALERLFSARGWPDPEAVRKHLETWAALQPGLSEAHDAVQRAGAAEAVARLARAEESLERRIQKRFRASAISRATPSERLVLLKQLVDTARTMDLPEAPIAEVSLYLPGWRPWFLLQGLSLAMLVPAVPVLAAVSLGLVFAAAAAFHFTSERVRYRLFRDVLVRECAGEPTMHLPLGSFEAGEAMAGTTLRGLMDLKLGSGKDSEAFCAELNRLSREREALQREERALQRFGGPPGRWLPASFERQDLSRREAIGLTMGGVALLSERGLLFVPDSARAEVRSVLFGIERVQGMPEHRPLQTLPAQLVLERLEDVRRVDGVRWCAAGIELHWTWVDQHEEVDLMGGRLAVTVDETSRAELRALWPT